MKIRTRFIHTVLRLILFVITVALGLLAAPWIIGGVGVAISKFTTLFTYYDWVFGLLGAL